MKTKDSDSFSFFMYYVSGNKIDWLIELIFFMVNVKRIEDMNKLGEV